MLSPLRQFALAVTLVAPALAQGMTISLNANPTLASNTAALAAFQRAANQWTSRFSDPIHITIDAGLDSTLSALTIGATSNVFLFGDYDEIRDAMVADSALDPDDGINAFLPTSLTFDAYVPSGTTLTGSMAATKANLKAMGFTGLDAAFGVSDAEIVFNPNFLFDYDNSDGVFGIDFETVAAHEIGHALGFVSIVDNINAGLTNVLPMPLDLYRFRDGDSASDPTTPLDFATRLRDLVPGQNHIFDDTISEIAFSRGVLNPAFPGTDGRQASHWRDDELAILYTGIMDPTLGFGIVELPEFADLRALDLIGYDFIVPEPTSIAMIGVTALLLKRQRA